MSQRRNFQLPLAIAIVLLLSVSVLQPTPANAQNTGGRISYGDTVHGTYTKNNTQEWVFRGTAGDVISIQLSPDKGPVNGFTLTDELGVSVVGVGSPIGAFPDPYHLDNFALPRTGVYHIFVGGYYSASGDYTLSLQLVSHNANPSKFSDTGGPITYNSSVVGRLTSTKGIDIWTFSGKRGDVIAITVTTADLNYLRAYFTLQTTTGAVRERNSTAFPVDTTTLPITGDYLIKITGDSGSTLYYTLSLQLVKQNGDDGVQPTEGGIIQYGQLVVGFFNDKNGDTNTWNFCGTQGDIITVLRRYLVPTNDSGWPDLSDMSISPVNEQTTFLKPTNLKSFGKNNMSGDYQLPMSGIYIINIHGVGVPLYYELLITPSLQNANISQGGTLGYGTVHAGQFTASDQEDKWIFTGNAGDKITISMKPLSGDLIADFELLGPDGNSLTPANPSADRVSAELVDYTLPASGTYTIVSRPFSPGEQGTYNISLVGTGPTVTEAPQTTPPPNSCLNTTTSTTTPNSSALSATNSSSKFPPLLGITFGDETDDIMVGVIDSVTLGTAAATDGLLPGDIILGLSLDSDRDTWPVLRQDKLFTVRITTNIETYGIAIHQPTISLTGSLIGSVDPGSAAEKAGIQPGDTILAINGQYSPTADDLTTAVRKHAAGDTVEIMGYHPPGSDGYKHLFIVKATLGSQ